MPGLGRKRKRNWLIGSSLLLPVAGGSWPSGAAPVAGSSATAFTIAPSVQYHPNSQSATLNGSNQVLDCADLKGLAPVFGLSAISGNAARNPNVIGAVAGSPGTMPTYWGTALGGLTRTVVGTGVYNGIPYADIRFNGTTTGTFANITLDTVGAIPAANGQTWTTVSYIAIVGGALTNITSIRQRAALYDGVVAYLGELVGTPADISGSLTATLARQAATTGTIASATTATINPYIQLSFSSGVAIDITLRIGLPDLEQAASATTPTVVGPTQMTDARGRKFWRFSGSHLLTIASSLVFTKRNCAMLVIGRNHRANTTSAVLGGQGQSTGMLEATWASSRMPVPRVFNKAYTTLDATYNNLIVGSQLHLIGAASSGTRVIHLMNDKDGSTTQVGTDATCNGGFIGGTSTGANGEWDVYEVAIWNTNQTDANIKAQRDLMFANWGLTTVTSQVVTMGDSITKGVTGVDSGSVPSVRIAEPGMGYIPDGCRVVNVGSGGQTINDAVSERDAANTFTQFTLAGGAANNKILFHMGTNDMGAIGGTQTAAAVYAEVVALLNSASPSGYLQKGWKVYVANNTAADDSTKAVQIPALRALYNDPQFLTDTLSNTGQTYDGLVKVIQTHLITKSPDGTIFDTQADAQSLVYYKDGLHPNEAGNDVLVSGGDTPQYGFGAGISL